MSRAPSTGWTPTRLPAIRDSMMRAHQRAADGMRAAPDAYREHGIDDPLDVAAAFSRVALRLRVADLYWATAAMTAVALDASSDLPEWSASAAVPSPEGLLVWGGGGMPHLPWTGAPESAWQPSPLVGRVPPTVPVDGILWGPAPGGQGVEVAVLTRAEPIREHLHGGWLYGELFAFSRLSPPLPLHEPITDADSPTWASGLVAAVGATWLLMQQPTVATPRPVPVDRDIRAAYRAASRPQPAVTIVDLRRLAQPERESAGEDSGREYHHRWLVRGHWRQQPYGPGRELRRPTWIAPHIKGPEGAPILATETVMVWRR